MSHEQDNTPMDFDTLRRDFPVAERFIYMDVATQGPISLTTKRSIEPHINNRVLDNDDEHPMLAHAELVRAQFADLIGADVDEISITKNASEGLNIVASAIAWKAGDNIVFCPTIEHANNVLPWLRVHKMHGVELRAVLSQDGFMPTREMARSIDARTRVIALSTATMAPGFQSDFQVLAEAARRHSAFLLADGAQSVGILHTDVKAMGLDGLSVSSVKGLMALYGLGFFYCRKSWAESLNPPYIARFSLDMGDLPESAPVTSNYKLRSGAKRFDIGHYNFPAIVSVGSSIKQLKKIGPKRIDAHVKRLAAELTNGFLRLGLPVCGGSPGPHTGSIVSLGGNTFPGNSGVLDSKCASLYEVLCKNKVRLAVRRGVLRFSLHAYNNEDDVNRVLALTSSWMSS